MDGDNVLTPRKLFQNAFARTSSQTSMASSPSLMAVRTPTSLVRARHSSCNATNTRFNLLPVIQTPPSCLLKGRVVNPFEPHLADRLHLPMIGSPSLFQRPSTPHNNSFSQFEWTIDEVSSLGPANVEVHETQFFETPDPAMEARVQAAINTYFKDHSIVPSPIDCQLRNQKLVLSNDSVDLSSASSVIGRSKKKTHDGVCQTILTFPPQLPKNVEDMLQKYLTFDVDQQQNHRSKLDDSSISKVDHDARDASLRRKLFNTSGVSDDTDGDGDAGGHGHSLDVLDLRALSPAPVSPEVLEKQDPITQQDLKRSRYFGSQDVLFPGDISLSPVINSDGESSFGALSPISKTSLSSSPNDACEQQHSDVDGIYRSTPEPCTSNQSDQFSPELSGSRSYMDGSVKHTELTNVLAEVNLSNDGDVLASSAQTLDSSQRPQHGITPLRRHQRKKKRHSHRKNLTQSFQLINHENNDVDGQNTRSRALSPIKEVVGVGAENMLRNTHFYRADSGFNEENQSNDYVNDLCDVSMVSAEFLEKTSSRTNFAIVFDSACPNRYDNESSLLRLEFSERAAHPATFDAEQLSGIKST